jgi:Domain of unknown function (DUF1707)/Cell wall-active antibiotics response 4TMS YvqF
MFQVTVQPDPPFDPGKLRASDADREAVARVLQTAMAEGRLSVTELQERLDTVYSSKTLSELEPVTWDLPGHTALVPAVPNLTKRPTATPDVGQTAALARVGGTPSSSVAIGIMSGATRKGQWVVPTQFTALAIMGGIDIDLTQATFAERVVTITAVAIMGGIDIVVPDDITVQVNGAGVMGAFEDSAHVQGVPGGPVVRINGVAIMGAVDVHRPKKRRDELEK